MSQPDDELFFSLVIAVRAWRWLAYLFIGMGLLPLGIAATLMSHPTLESWLMMAGVSGACIAFGVGCWYVGRAAAGRIELRRSGMMVDVLRRRGQSIPWSDVKAVSITPDVLTIAFHEHATLQLMSATEGYARLAAMGRVVAHQAGIELIDQGY